jgi:two-component system response regulator MtrA
MAERVLAVGEQERTARLIQQQLPPENYELVIVPYGPAAMAEIERHKPDWIVLDAMAPYMESFQLLRSLQANRMTREIPVLLVSDRAADATVFRGWFGGIRGWRD